MNNFAGFLEMVKIRQSTRAYKTLPVENDKITRCIEAARLSPSACNAQPWKFIVVNIPELRNALADATHDLILPLNHFTKQAPVHVVIVREKANFTSAFGQVVKDKEYPLMDIGIAAAHFCLQAVEEGLGTCIVGWFNEKKVRNLLSIPKNKRVELIITVGYPASDDIRPKKRKPWEEICAYNSYKSKA
jgi:nitroreductase